MKRLAFVLAIGLAGACGDDSSATPDASPDIDAPPDTPLPGATLTSFVKDLITNQTVNTTGPVDFATFATLPDPDGDTNNTMAYTSLFP